MQLLVNAFVALELVCILFLVVYLLDRVNTVEQETRHAMQIVSMPHEAAPAHEPVEQLSGRKLWDAVIGAASPRLEAGELAALRERYDLILHKHMEAIYKQGFRDGQRGLSGSIACVRTISTARGQIESWLPDALVRTVYTCGFNAAQKPIEEWGEIRQELDAAANEVYAQARLQVRQSLSSWLMSKPLAADAPAAVSG
jgi:hypothetical protein